MFGMTTSCAEQKTKVKTSNKQEVKKMSTTELTLAIFKDKVMDYEANPKTWNFKGDKPAIIDFYATWCGPCKGMAPVVDSIAEKYAGKIDVYKVDIDKQQELAAMFGIRSIPTLLFIPMNGKPNLHVGAMNTIEFEDMIKTLSDK